jgi:DNA replicative helicase MCM subunit Mcm2 (Cdc46/Mcm family)
VLAIAKSIARLEGDDVVRANHVRLALEQFVDARKDVFDAWDERSISYNPEHLSVEAKVKRIGKTAERIYRYLVEEPNSLRTELREALPRVQDRIFDNAVEEMIRLGVIYMSSNTEERYSVA